MELGGNHRAKDFLKKHGKEGFGGYDSDNARRYKLELEAKVNKKFLRKMSSSSNDAKLQALTQTPEKSNRKKSEETVQNLIEQNQVKLKEDNELRLPSSKSPNKKSNNGSAGEENNQVEKKSFKVKFNTKFNKNSGPKKGLVSKKIDHELDFNKMSLGDNFGVKSEAKDKRDSFNKGLNADFLNVNEANECDRKSKSNGFTPSPTKKQKEKSNEYNTEHKHEDLAKFKNLQGVGSDMINENKESEQNKMNIQNYSNCNALSSDQLFGREDNIRDNRLSSDSFGFDTKNLESSIRTYGTKLSSGAENLYSKLKNAWDSYN